MTTKIKRCFCLTENFEIVRSLKSSIIKNIVKAYQQKDFIHTLRITPHISDEDFFSALPATILLTLDNNDVIGFAFDIHKNTIVSWYDVRKDVEYSTKYYQRDFSKFMQYHEWGYLAQTPWTKVIDKKIDKISVLETVEETNHDSKNSIQSAIILETTDCDIVLFSLAENETFSITTKVQLPEEIWEKSTLIEL